MAATKASAARNTRTKKKERKNIAAGTAHIQSTFNTVSYTHLEVVYDRGGFVYHGRVKALLGDALANLLGSVAVAAIVLKVLFQGGGGSQRNTRCV